MTATIQCFLVLENVKIKSAVTPNMYANFANNDKPLDVPRISATNPKPPTITNINSIVLYPDGTIKNYTPCNVQNQGKKMLFYDFEITIFFKEVVDTLLQNGNY